MSVIRIGSRKSPLALKQVDEIQALFERHNVAAECEVVLFDTRGDRDKATPIDRLEGSDFFTDEIQAALIDGTIDCAVHSAKDLPDSLIAGHSVYIADQSIDPDEVLVSKNNCTFDMLPEGARIGTSSTRRKEQLLRRRPDLVMCDIRGNIGERLAILDEGDLDGIVIAAAGLVRLGLSDRISERLIFLEPHPLQGKLALEMRSDDVRMKEVIEQLLGWSVWQMNE